MLCVGLVKHIHAHVQNPGLSPVPTMVAPENLTL